MTVASGTSQPPAKALIGSHGASVNSNASPGHLAALCTDLSPGIPLLALAYPEFSIGQSSRGRNGPAWTVIRKDPTQPGLYAAVTPDLGELREILARHAAQQPDADTGNCPVAQGREGAAAEHDGDPFPCPRSQEHPRHHDRS